MTDREKFEKWADGRWFGDLTRQAAYDGWQARQPEIDELNESRSVYVALASAQADRADKAEAEVVRLREAIRDAPHTQSCRMWKDCARDDCGLHPGSIVHDMEHPKSHLHHTFEPGKCTCWKRAALKEE